jgi:capsular polysaccharide biosynthesis protein
MANMNMMMNMMMNMVMGVVMTAMMMMMMVMMDDDKARIQNESMFDEIRVYVKSFG